MLDLSPETLGNMIDHTFLKPCGKVADIETLYAEARDYGFAMVAVNPAEVERCVRLLSGSPVRVGAAPDIISRLAGENILDRLVRPNYVSNEINRRT